MLQVTVATASLSSVLFAHTNCVCFGRERNAVATTLRLFLPHAVIYQEEPEEARGGGEVGGWGCWGTPA